MSLIEDIKDSFKKKGLEFVSITEATDDRDKSILTYRDASEGLVTRTVDIRIDDLEEAVEAVYNVDPMDLANYLLSDSRPILASPPATANTS
jgi:3-dehydroquinate dehydratase